MVPKAAHNALEIVPRRLCGPETTQQRNTIRRGLAGEIANERPEGIIDTSWQRHIDDALRPAVFLEIDPRKRRPARHRNAEVEKIRCFAVRAPSTVLAKITAFDSAQPIDSPALGALSSR